MKTYCFHSEDYKDTYPHVCDSQSRSCSGTRRCRYCVSTQITRPGPLGDPADGALRPAGEAPGAHCVPHSAVFQRPDPATTRKLQTAEEIGVPVPRNGSVLGLKSQNGYGPPKPPLGSPSPRLSKTPTHLPTILDEPGKKVKKSAPLQHFSPPLKASQGLHGASDPSKCESHRPGAITTSPKVPAAVTANGHGPKGATEKGDSSSSSPERSPSSDPAQAPKSGARACDPQGPTPSAAGPPRALPSGEDAKAAKPRGPVLSSTASEPASAMSPPPAKKLALSAKKVGVRGFRRWPRVSRVLVWGSRKLGLRRSRGALCQAFPGLCRRRGLSRGEGGVQGTLTTWRHQVWPLPAGA